MRRARQAWVVLAFLPLLFPLLPKPALAEQQGESCNVLNQLYFPRYGGKPDNTVYICDGSLMQSFMSATASPLAVDFLGNVGIGSTSPGALLDIGLAGTTLGTMRLEGNTSGYVQLQTAAAAGSWTLTLPPNAGTSGYLLETDGTGITSWIPPGTINITLGTSASATNPQRSGDATTGLFSPAAGTVAVAASGTQELTVNTTGVGIGSTSPAFALDVVGNISQMQRSASAATSTGIATYVSGNTGWLPEVMGTDSEAFLSGSTSPTLIGVSGYAQEDSGTLSQEMEGGDFEAWKEDSDTTNEMIGVSGYAELDAGTLSQNLEGGDFEAHQDSSVTSGTATGIYGYAEQDAGTLTNLYGADIEAEANSPTTNLYGTYTVAGGSGGTVTNEYGVYIDTGAAATNKYGLYQADSASANYFAGKVGIGTTSPAASLDLSQKTDAAALPAGTTGQRPSSPVNGEIRYNSTVPQLEAYVNGAWVPLNLTTCTNTTPTAFSFTNLTGQSTSTLVTSNIVQVTGMTCNVGTSISGNGSPEYRICTDSACSTVVQGWTSAIASISPNQYLQLELTTASTGGVTYSATVTAGNTATVWTAATTGSCTSTVGSVCPDGTVYAGLTPDGNVPMYVTPCDVGQTWNGTTCTGTNFLEFWNNGGTSYINEGQNNPSTGKANTADLAALNDADSPHQAAQYCHNLNQNGYTDWYLPAINELAVISAGAAAIGHFTNVYPYWYYWSSTEYDTADASILNVRAAGTPTDLPKNSNTPSMRCARHN